MWLKRLKIGLILGFFSLAAILLPLVTTGPVSAQSVPTVVMQGNTTVANGSTFTLDIVAAPDAALPIGVAQVYLDFNENFLQVVSGGHPSGPLIPGPVLDSTWGEVILNSADNSTGEIGFAGGKGLAGGHVQTPFVLARVQFQAMAETPAAPGTELVFNVTVP